MRLAGRSAFPQTPVPARQFTALGGLQANSLAQVSEVESKMEDLAQGDA